MKKSLAIGLLFAGCAVNYRADDAAFQCEKFGHCTSENDAGMPDASAAGGASSAGGAGKGGAGGGATSGGAGGLGAGGLGAGGGVPVACPSATTCTNPDTSHCVSGCEQTDAGVACVLRGRDDDGDGHGWAACTDATVPADDCDDTKRDVHPGATETCNGIDDDCNGKVDLDDGLPLGGAPEKFVQQGERPVTLHWSKTAGVYGIGWTEALQPSDGGAKHDHLRFTALDERGDTVKGGDTDLTPAGKDESMTDLALGADDFRMLSVRNGGTTLDFRSISYSGGDAGMPKITATTPQLVGPVPPTSRPTVVALDLFSVATWFEVQPDTSSIGNYSAILTGSPIGAPTPSPVDARTQRDIASTHIGPVASYTFVSCTIPGHGDAGSTSRCSTQVKIIDFTGNTAGEYGPFAVSASNGQPQMASIAGNDKSKVFAVGWVENDSNAWSFDYALVSTDGKIVCGPTRYMTRTALKETDLGFRDAPSIAPSPDGSFLAAVAYGTRLVYLAKLDAACKNVESTPLLVSSESHGFVGSPSIATSGSSVVAMWTDAFATTTIQIRKMSPLLCSTP